MSTSTDMKKPAVVFLVIQENLRNQYCSKPNSVQLVVKVQLRNFEHNAIPSHTTYLDQNNLIIIIRIFELAFKLGHKKNPINMTFKRVFFNI